jgi:hypothetical protein
MRRQDGAADESRDKMPRFLTASGALAPILSALPESRSHAKFARKVSKFATKWRLL